MPSPSLTTCTVRRPHNAHFARLATALTAAALVVPLGLAGPAAAAAPSWSKVVALTPPPGGDYGVQSVPDPAGGALLYYPRNGVPTLVRVSATGAVGAQTPVPTAGNLGNAGTPGSIAFLPNGAAVISWNLGAGGQYGPYMAYRAANGTWGKPVALTSGFSSLAVRNHEILTAQSAGNTMTVATWSLSAAGAIGSAGTAKTVYSGSAEFNESWLALDPRGSAELIVNGTDGANNGVVTVSRSTSGTWGSQHLLSAGSGVQSVSVATTPGGRTVAGWVEVTGNYASSTVFGAIRSPGGDFGTPVSTGEDSVADSSNLALAKVAAGTDGTLAVGTTLEVQALDGSYSDTNSVEIAGPSQSALGNKHTITGSVSAFTISSLGAGDSKAIVGTVQQDYGPPADNESYQESQLTSATVVTAATSTSHTFGTSSGTYDGNGGEGCKCAAQPPPLSVGGVSLDAHGVGAAIGILKPGGPISYSVEGAKAPRPRVTITSTKVKATTSHAPVALSCSAAACKGTLTLVIGKKTEARASYSIKAGRHATVQAKLTKAGKKAFKHAKAHHVKATVKVTVKGGTTVTKKLTVT